MLIWGEFWANVLLQNSTLRRTQLCELGLKRYKRLQRKKGMEMCSGCDKVEDFVRGGGGGVKLTFPLT